MQQEVGRLTILVADDEPEVVNLVRTLLEWQRYSVLDAADGRDAIQQARRMVPDLILLDVRMPRMNGLTVLERLQADPLTEGIPVIMLSVVTTYSEVRSALQRGAVAYLSKPFELKEMLELVQRVLSTDPATWQALREAALRNVGRE
ncbi:MAG: two-component system response regulator [Anaerolineae bacterium]